MKFRDAMNFDDERLFKERVKKKNWLKYYKG